ncbi:tetratricopeptide repeat protein [Iningainema tapete]|uniref:Tetratricopeptide repeat protein n=1 Tax=Iningainema tapete BLCC-T55 TaxID=2748662 RepID=A0A8J7CI99_9CYAN|nr:tetratricopeptide repeat protein [Iningainema tapete]MBD2778785.1 tetratricopeptide repeat protein [Iningainema tapete BLCC-T55]
MKRGQNYLDTGNKDKAIKDFLTASQLYIKVGDMKEVITSLDKLLKIAPTNSEAYNERGIAKSNLNDYEGAIKDFDQAIRLKPNFALAYLNRGITRFSMSRFLEIREKNKIFYVFRDDGHDIIQDLQQAVLLFNQQKDEVGQKRVREVAKKIQETFSKAIILYDDDQRKIQDALNKLQQPPNVP